MKRIREIVLADVHGSVIESRGIKFVPARFDFEADSEGGLGTFLDEYVDEYDQTEAAISSTAEYFAEEFWCLARIAAEFGVSPPSGVILQTDSCLNLGFLAVWMSKRAGKLRVMPFICLGNEESAGLVFRRRDSGSKTSEMVAKAFWRILCHRSNFLAPLDFLLYDDYEGEWANVCSFDGRVFVTDTHDDDPDARFGRTDPHAVRIWYPDGLPCPECSGVGEESFDPAGEPCGYCDGTGFAD